MQAISYRKIASSMYDMPQSDEEILHYTLAELLPEGHTLAMNVLLGTLSLIANDSNLPHPRMVAEQQFTLSELSLLLPLLNAHPHYCPYEVLLASFNHRMITEATIERCRKRLQDAQDEGVWDQEMRPVRNVLSRTRLKIRGVEVAIPAILTPAYVLIPLPLVTQLPP